MRITVQGRTGQTILLLSLVAGFVLSTVWIVKNYFADRAGHTLSMQSLTHAARLNPGDARYHVQLGRLYQYSVNNPKPKMAIRQFEKAIKDNPYDPKAWINLAAAYEFQGDTAKAEEDLRHASDLAPNLPIYQWTIGNYFLLHGNTAEAFRHLRRVLAGSREYDQTVFNVAWKASGDAGQILHELIPHDLPAEFSYLKYLVVHQRFSDAHAVWKRIAESPQKFDPHKAASYIDTLIRARRPEAAYQVWTDLQAKGLVPAPPGGPVQDLMTNGNFETPLLNMGFGWRMQDIPGVYAGLDSGTFHSPGHSFSVQFAGKQNLNYHQLFQFVKVLPSHAYRLQAYVKTQGITSDSGPRLEVVDAYDPAALNKYTQGMTGTSGGWNPVNLKFKTGPKTQLLIVALVRLPSKSEDDTAITGTVWLDDVTINPATQ